MNYHYFKKYYRTVFTFITNVNTMLITTPRASIQLKKGGKQKPNNKKQNKTKNQVSPSDRNKMYVTEFYWILGFIAYKYLLPQCHKYYYLEICSDEPGSYHSSLYLKFSSGIL